MGLKAKVFFCTTLFIKKFGWDICVVQFNGFRILFERHWNIRLQLKHVLHKRWGDQKLFCKRNCKCFSPDHLIHSSNSSTTFPGQYFWWKHSQIKKQISFFHVSLYILPNQIINYYFPMFSMYQISNNPCKRNGVLFKCENGSAYPLKCVTKRQQWHSQECNWSWQKFVVISVRGIKLSTIHFPSLWKWAQDIFEHIQSKFKGIGVIEGL